MKSSWLWLSCVALTSMACVGGLAGRARKPSVESLLAESRAALTALDVLQAQELAEQAETLHPRSKPARTWADLFREGAAPWTPPELREPLPAPGPHVVPGALLFVGIPSLPLTPEPTLSAESADALPLGAAVSVLDVEGGWARVRRVVLGGMLTPGAPPRWHAIPLPSVADEHEGYVAARFLEPTPVDLDALRQQVRTLLAAGSREEALTAMELLLFTEAGEPELPQEMHRLALELERVPAAIRAARATTEESSPPAPLELELSLRYGCRGKVLEAQVQTEAQAAPEPADACITDVDITPPKGELSITDCSFANPQTEEEREFRARVVAEAFERVEKDRVRYAEEMDAYHARLRGLREHHPLGPFLCVSVIHPGGSPRWNVPVQLYSMPSAGDEKCSYAADEPEIEASPAVGRLRLDGLRLPYLAPGDTIEICRQEPRYEDTFFGAVQAPDAQTATEFVHRREEIQFELVTDPWDWGDKQREWKEKLKTLSEELPNVQLSTAFGPNCNLDCY